MMKIFKMFDFFGIEPQECLYVGDSEVDFQVCQAAGVPPIAYKNKALKADIDVESLAELKQILKFPGGLRFNIVREKRSSTPLSQASSIKCKNS